MAIAFVRQLGSGTSKSSASSIAFTCSGTAAIGDTVIVSYVGSTTTSAVSSVTDTQGNTYTVLSDVAGTTSRIAIAGSVLTTALTTSDVITVNLAAASSVRVVAGNDFSGLTLTQDVTAVTAHGTSSTPSTGASAATTTANTLTFGAFGVSNGTASGTFTQGTGFTLDQAATTGTSGTNRSLGTEHRINSSTGTQTANGSYGTSMAWDALEVVLQAAAATTAKSASDSATATDAIAGSANVGPGYVAAVQADSPILYWRLNEPAGATSVADSSGNSRTGTPTSETFGSARLLANEPNATAATQGSTSRIDLTSGDSTVANFTGNAPFSIAVWCRYAGAQTAGVQTTLVNKESFITNWEGWWLGTNGTAAGFQFERAAAGVFHDTADPAIPVAGTIYFVVATYDGANQRVYTNGSLTGGPTADSLSIISGNTTVLRVGEYYDGTLPMVGDIQEVAIFDCALSANEIANLWSIGSNAPAVTDTATFTEATQFGWAATDAATLTDVVGGTGLSASDSASAAEATGPVALSTVDTAALSEATGPVALATPDSSALSEATGPIALATADAAAATDAIGLVGLSQTDGGALSESQSLNTGATPITDSDSAALTEQTSIVQQTTPTVGDQGGRIIPMLPPASKRLQALIREMERRRKRLDELERQVAAARHQQGAKRRADEITRLVERIAVLSAQIAQGQAQREALAAEAELQRQTQAREQRTARRRQALRAPIAEPTAPLGHADLTVPRTAATPPLYVPQEWLDEEDLMTLLAHR